jgi:hypothetical protein
MQINISHARNPLIGWDIGVKVQADAGQQISDVEIRINQMHETIAPFNDGLSSWETQLTSKGVYPGTNRVEVTVTDQNANQTSAEQSWS